MLRLMVGALLVPVHSPFGSVLNPLLFGFLVFREIVNDIPAQERLSVDRQPLLTKYLDHTVQEE